MARRDREEWRERTRGYNRLVGVGVTEAQLRTIVRRLNLAKRHLGKVSCQGCGVTDGAT